MASATALHSVAWTSLQHSNVGYETDLNREDTQHPVCSPPSSFSASVAVSCLAYTVVVVVVVFVGLLWDL